MHDIDTCMILIRLLLGFFVEVTWIILTTSLSTTGS